MTWEDVEKARKRVKEAEVGLRWAKNWLEAVEEEARKIEKAYVAAMGVEVRYRSRRDPFHDVYEAHISGQWCAEYESEGQVIKAVREAELAGTLTNQSEDISKLK